MYIYKKLKGSDSSIVPFNTNKGHYYVFEGGELPLGAYDNPSRHNIYPGTSGSGIRIQPAYWEQKPLAYYSESNLVHRQLEHNFYRDYPLAVVDKMGDIDYIKQKRHLDKEAIVISIPQGLYGDKIQPGTFRYVNYVQQRGWLGPSTTAGMMITVIDDGYGNLYIPETVDKNQPSIISALANMGMGGESTSSAITTSSYKELKLDDPHHNIFKLNPKNGYKNTQLNLDEYGVQLVNPPGHTLGVDWNELKITQSGDLEPNPYWYSHGMGMTSGGQEMSQFNEFNLTNGRPITQALLNPSLLNKKWIYDDSYYFNLLEYKDIQIWPNTEVYGQSFGHDYDMVNMGHLWTKKGCPQPGLNCVGGIGVPSRAYINPLVFWGRHRANDTGSYIKSPHNDKFNMNVGDDFTVSFWMYKYAESGSFADSISIAPSGAYDFNPSPSRSIGIELKDQFLISKSTTKTTIPPPSLTSAGVVNMDASGSTDEFETIAEPQYPFEIFYHPIAEITPLTILSASISCSDHPSSSSEEEGFGDGQRFYEPDCDIIYALSGSISCSSGDNFINDVGGVISEPISNTNHTSASIVFRRSDGMNTVSASLLLATGSNVWSHITCRYSASKLEIFENGEGVAWENRQNHHCSTFMNCSSSSHGIEGGFLSGSQQIYSYGGNYASSSDAISNPTYNVSGTWNPTSGGADLGNTQNTANMYIGSKGGVNNFYEGALYAINIWDYALDDHELWHISRGSGITSGDTHVGNIFYESGIATITNPLYSEWSTISSSGINWSYFDFTPMAPMSMQHFNHTGSSYTQTTCSIEFKATHPIYENEYQCTIDESEFNYTNNITARKIKSELCPDVADFATGSNFKPYITQLGLYNEENELLVVGKLGQPVKTSNETDTTFVLRWDT